MLRFSPIFAMFISHFIPQKPSKPHQAEHKMTTRGAETSELSGENIGTFPRKKRHFLTRSSALFPAFVHRHESRSPTSHLMKATAEKCRRRIADSFSY